jgi:glycosyltransferase involved in cell wall biosynthesis
MSVLGLLPAIRGGLGELARTGQHARLIDSYLRPYARAFDAVRYFSYLPESLGAFTTDRELLERVTLLPGRGHPWLYTLLLPLRHRRALAGCSVLRVFQITGAVPAIVARRWFGVPFVTTYGFRYADLSRSPLTRTLRRAVESMALASADAIIVTTPALEAYVRWRRPRGEVHLVPNGVDTTLFRPIIRAPRDVREVLYVGRLSEEKNLGALVEAAARVKRARVRVTLVGDGPERATLEGRARALGVALQVHPVVPHPEVARLMATADAFVLASFNEGHPKVLLEAMAAGAPCVASDCEGNRSLVAEGQTGLLFDPRRPDELAGQLERVLLDGSLAASLTTAARTLVTSRYDLGSLVADEIQLLKQVGGLTRG